MEKYFSDKKDDIRRQNIVTRLIEPKISKEFVNAIIGPRRAGKTFFLYDIIKRLNLKDEDFLFINFEDDEIKEMKREEKVKCVYKHVEIYSQEPKYLFFDEIQNLEGWRSFIYSLVEKHRYFIFITGSSSKLLSKEISTQLRGRSLNICVFPFSFKEFMAFKNIEIKKIYSSIEEAKIRNFLREYIRSGGFPQVVLKKIDKETFFKEYLNVVLYKDLIERYKIENPEVARFLLHSVIHSFSKEFSINKIYKQLKQRSEVSNKTLYKYFSYLEEVFFSFLLRKFSYSYKQSLLSISKVYIADTGLTSNLEFSENIGKLMENITFLKLKQLELNNFIELFYWKDYQQREVDFVIKENAIVKQLIQVSYASSREEIKDREIRSLLKASVEVKCNNLLVITWDYEGGEEIKGKKIRFLPLWKWLLGFGILTIRKI